MAERKRGRRPAADEKIVRKHRALILEADAEEKDLRRKLDVAMTRKAKRLDKAAQDGVATNEMADWLQCSRQNIHKLVRERVDGK